MPVLGICYGLQAIAHELGGAVERASRREFGRAHLIVDEEADLFRDIADGATVWMSHGDHLTRLPDGFRTIAHTENAPIAAVAAADQPIFGVQFHPEVVHTEPGRKLIENFVYQRVRVRGATGRRPRLSKTKSARSRRRSATTT